MKFFNTAGPVNQAEHYKIDPLTRWDLDEILMLIAQKKYFIIHAPRQTGKTSSMLALQEYLNNEGKYFAVYANFEVGQASRNDIREALLAISSELTSRLEDLLKGRLDVRKFFNDLVPIFPANTAIETILKFVCQHIDKPVVLLIDEIDSLVGDTLISVLRQIRAGYDKRPDNFPSSIVLCGVRDIKDYRIQTSGKDIITGGSAFNIKSESLRLGNFSKEEVITLYQEHTKETGQKFKEECFDLVMDYTNGQPWLVNALAYQVAFKMKEGRNRNIDIDSNMLRVAKEQLILSRQTHLDQLADKLEEDRVRRVILPIILGEEIESHKDDEEYCLDLGIIKKTSSGLEISNSIYREIIPRELNQVRQENFLSLYRPDWIDSDGSINVKTLLTLFRDFWNDNSAIWGSHIQGYQEAAPQLVTQAFLQRVANGSGSIAREYGVARKRTDLMLKWKYEKNGEILYQKIVMELKVVNKKNSYEKIKEKALEQTAQYASICGSDQAHILVFDRDLSQGWSAREENEIIDHNGVTITVWKLRHEEEE